ncbi:unnamed protein product [Lactuca saligna]|uniref:Uncharacterized protein n=1 Tax=Lactuca saligna TaxID=75948 RepID=A0AA36A0F3_LACSI|nr:unnamed protein product [Lactuca saligna]
MEGGEGWQETKTGGRRRRIGILGGGSNPCYFKIDTEELKFLPSVVGVNGTIYFGESRGHLHLVLRKWADRGERHLQLNVYEMLNDYSGWFLKYRVELDELLNAYPQMIQTIKVIGRDQDPSIPQLYNYSVLDVVRGEEDDETFMAIFIPGKIIKSNVYDKSFKQIFNLSPIIYKSQVHRFIETLVSF